MSDALMNLSVSEDLLKKAIIDSGDESLHNAFFKYQEAKRKKIEIDLENMFGEFLAIAKNDN